MKSDLVSIIEAAYRADLSEPRWLAGLLDAAAPQLDAGRGIVAYTYDASAEFTFLNLVTRGLPKDGEAKLGAYFSKLSPSFVKEAFGKVSFGFFSDAARAEDLPILRELIGPSGWSTRWASTGAIQRGSGPASPRVCRRG